MTQIEIITTNKGQQYFATIVDLLNNKVDLNSDFHGWFKLSLNGLSDSTVDISEIRINNESIAHGLYTGFAVNQAGEILQPCTAFNDKLEFSIWLHTNLGEFFASLYSQIRNGDYGTNLFANYQFTVDKPIQLADIYPESIKTFFARATGPHWWHHHSDDCPYAILDIALDQKLQNSIDQLENYMLTQTIYGKPFVQKTKGANGNWRQLNSPVATSQADAMPMESIPIEYLQSILYKIGYRKILSYSILELDPKSYIEIHVDDYYSSKNYKYLVGAKKFYVSFNVQDEIYFKLGNAGILPLDKPLLINSLKHVHSVVNDSNQIRKAFMVYGIMEQDL